MPTDLSCSLVCSLAHALGLPQPPRCRHDYRPRETRIAAERRSHAACRLSQVACGKPRVHCVARRRIATCTATECLATPIESALTEIVVWVHMGRGERGVCMPKASIGEMHVLACLRAVLGTAALRPCACE